MPAQKPVDDAADLSWDAWRTRVINVTIQPPRLTVFISIQILTMGTEASSTNLQHQRWQRRRRQKSMSAYSWELVSSDLWKSSDHGDSQAGRFYRFVPRMPTPMSPIQWPILQSTSSVLVGEDVDVEVTYHEVIEAIPPQSSFRNQSRSNEWADQGTKRIASLQNTRYLVGVGHISHPSTPRCV